MKKILILLVFVSSFLTSCIKLGLDELPVYNLTKITTFNMEYRFEAKNANGVSYVEDMGIPTTVKIDTIANVVNVTPTLPAANSIFTVAERQKVSLSNLVAFCSLETAASIKPIGNSPKMGIPADWSTEHKYLVTAADGKTTREWTIKVSPLITQ